MVLLIYPRKPGSRTTKPILIRRPALRVLPRDPSYMPTILGSDTLYLGGKLQGLGVIGRVRV